MLIQFFCHDFSLSRLFTDFEEDVAARKHLFENSS